VTNDQLFDAYEAQALLAKQEGRSFKKMRVPTWKSSNKVIFSSNSIDELQCPVLSSGTHKWSIGVEEKENHVHLGVALTVHTLENNSFLGYQEGGWSYSTGGNGYHNSGSTYSSEATRRLKSARK
jgi:hypothetical protein